MKYLKKFEELDEDNEPIDIISYPDGYIITVNNSEFELLKQEFDISWDDEPDYEEGVIGQWRFNDDDSDEIEKWLEGYRLIKDPKLYKDTKNYNI
jgi:hypothetical protein